MTTTWNPADKSSFITLSSTNHTMTNVGGGNGGARTTPVTHSSGKWYFEFTVNAFNTSGGAGLLGIANVTYDYTSTAPDDNNAGGIHPQIGNPDFFSNPTGSPNLGAVTGHVIGVAVDFDNNKCWMNYDGGLWWNQASGSQNPVGNVGGAILPVVGTRGAMMPMVRTQNNGDSVTVNTGDSAFTGSIPSGFTAWDGTPPPAFSHGTVIH